MTESPLPTPRSQLLLAMQTPPLLSSEELKVKGADWQRASMENFTSDSFLPAETHQRAYQGESCDYRDDEWWE